MPKQPKLKDESRTLEILKDKKYTERKELRSHLYELKKVHNKIIRVNNKLLKTYNEKVPLRVLKDSLISRIKKQYETLIKAEKRKVKCKTCLKVFTPHKNNPHQIFCSDFCKGVDRSKQERLERAPKVFEKHMGILLKRRKELDNTIKDWNEHYKKRVTAIEKSKTTLDRSDRSFSYKQFRERNKKESA